MHDHLLIDGRLVAGAGLLPVIEPASGQVFAHAPRADALQAEQAVAAGKRAARDWALVPMDKRAAVLEALADALQAHAEPFARMLTREQGKLLDESRGEVEGSIAALRYHAGLRLEPRVLEQSADELVVEQRFPLGLVVAIVPWNYPLLMLILKLAPALLAGNTVIAKPAPTTPLTTLMLGTLAAEIVPPAWCRCWAMVAIWGPCWWLIRMWRISASPARRRRAARCCRARRAASNA
jgi:acyl-CoA reductase-like NAD-dependent aldehyde dehydrogenase